MILYFSATGNSEYIAKNIAHLNNDEVINMGKYLKSNKTMNLSSDKPYVVVAPVYISTMPTIILDLLKNSNFEGNKNIYFIMTCAGSGISASSAFIKPLIDKKGLVYRGIEHISMPQNYLMFFKVDSKEENDAKLNNAISNISDIAKKIENNQDFNMSKVGIMHKMSIKPVIWLFDKFFIKPKEFYAMDECTGCSLCEKICPLNNIKMVDGKPKWENTCVHCTACINRCPKQAIEYGKKTKGKNRYVAPKFSPQK